MAEIDVQKEGVKGAKNFFEAKVRSRQYLSGGKVRGHDPLYELVDQMWPILEWFWTTTGTYHLQGPNSSFITKTLKSVLREYETTQLNEKPTSY